MHFMKLKYTLKFGFLLKYTIFETYLCSNQVVIRPKRSNLAKRSGAPTASFLFLG